MRAKIVLVVGDKFAKFAVGKDVITLTQLKAILSLPNFFRLEMCRIVLAPGQGLGDDDVQTVLSLAERTPHSEGIDFSLWRTVPKRASVELSHKHKPENILISSPQRVHDNAFVLDVLIHQDCELMSDHQTGQHLQGMILLEAARQSLLAVTEAFFIPANGPKFCFIFNALSINYSRFAFPFGAQLHYRIREKDLSGGRRLRFVVDIDIQQCGVSAAVFSAEFTAFEESRIVRQEDRQARDGLSQHFELVSQMTGDDNQKWPNAA